MADERYDDSQVINPDIFYPQAGAQLKITTGKFKIFDHQPIKIPDYQRGYCWEDKEITRLWNRVLECYGKKEYLHLGSIILQCKQDITATDNINGKYVYDIVDGQQRLVTLTLIMQKLGYPSDNLSLLKEEIEDTDSINHIENASALIKILARPVKKREELNKYISESISFTIISISMNNPDLAFVFFSNQNSGGIRLSDYDLLKAHHLRFIKEEQRAQHVATRWDNLSCEKEDSCVNVKNSTMKLERFLGGYLFCLRKLTRKALEIPIGNYVRDEFQAARTMDDLLPNPGEMSFKESIQGGERFFAYVDKFNNEYSSFISTQTIKSLRLYFTLEQRYYRDIIESILFAYYLKFHDQYLPEALFCICAACSQHRYEVARALRKKILEWANQSNLLQMIESASSPTFFIAETLVSFTRTYDDLKNENKDNKGTEDVRCRYHKTLANLFKDLKDHFSENTIKGRIGNGYY